MQCCLSNGGPALYNCKRREFWWVMCFLDLQESCNHVLYISKIVVILIACSEVSVTWKVRPFIDLGSSLMMGAWVAETSSGCLFGSCCSLALIQRLLRRPPPSGSRQHVSMKCIIPYANKK